MTRRKVDRRHCDYLGIITLPKLEGNNKADFRLQTVSPLDK